MRDDLKDQGYSKEEEYFHRKDQELIAKLREKAEAHRARTEEEHHKKDHWMRCPKCGSALEEHRYGNIAIDRCTSTECGGIFLDRGELEILMKAKSSVLGRIFGKK